MRRAATIATAVALLAPAAAAAHAAGPLPAEHGLAHFFALGVEHVLSGVDHLAFLAGLLLVAPGVASLVRTVTAFTVAHSATLALAVTGVFTLPPAVVEPAIAASVIFVAVDNLVRPEPRGRAAVAFAFGLVHGLGFAGALARHGLAGERLAPALLGFNLGVELGQLGLVLLAAPVLLSLRRTELHRKVGLPVTSAVLGGAGVYFLVLRLLS